MTKNIRFFPSAAAALNHIATVGKGCAGDGGVIYDVYEVK